MAHDYPVEERVAAALDRIAKCIEFQVSEMKRQKAHHEEFVAARAKVLNLLELESRWPNALDTALNYQGPLTPDLFCVLAQREDASVLLKEIMARPPLAKKLAWLDRDGIASELTAVERRLALTMTPRLGMPK